MLPGNLTYRSAQQQTWLIVKEKKPVEESKREKEKTLMAASLF